MNKIGRARNARLNQAQKHIAELHACLDALCGSAAAAHVDNKDAWADGRNAMEQLVQCFHEANAYNNAIAPE